MRKGVHGQGHKETIESSAGPTKPRSTDEGSSLPKRPRRNAANGSTPPPRLPLDQLPGLGDPPPGTRKVFVGGGPRTTTQLSAEIDFLFAHAEDFRMLQEAGGRYDIQRVVFERRTDDFLGRGSAWGPDQGGGTVNSGAERSGIDYAPRLESFLTENRAAFEEAYRDDPVASALLKASFESGDGTPNTSAGALRRKDQGREERMHSLAQQERAQTTFPFYRITTATETSVEAIDLAHPNQPVVSAKRVGDDESSSIKADSVILNTGMTLTSPVSDPEVLRHAHVAPMGALTGFLQAQELLDSQGKLKVRRELRDDREAGIKLALGGTGLSAMDQILALQPVMDLFEPDPGSNLGYRVSETAKQKYAGALTFISTTEGKWVPPRHVSKDCAWTQATDGLANSHEVHVALLHGKGEKLFTDYHDVMRASIACALGITLEQVDEAGLSTPELLRAQHARSQFHLHKLAESALAESMQTLEGAKRQAYLQAILGLGMERDLDAAIHGMERDAPLSFLGRFGYQMHRAQVAGLTGPQTPATNEDLLAAFGEWMAHITSSPVQVQSMAHLLVEAGIASHVQGTYSALAPNDDTDGRPLQFTAKNGEAATFDAFIVSPTPHRAEQTLQSLAGQVEPVHPLLPELGKVTSNRRIVAKGGQPSRVEDYSLNGKGAFVPGTRRLAGAFAIDVNNRESATDVAPGLAYRSMAAEHLAAVGVPNPLDEVDKLYLKYLPGDKEFAKEAATFEPHYRSLTTKAAFVRPADHASDGDAVEFASLLSKVRSGSRVRAQGALLEPVLQPAFDRAKGVPTTGVSRAAAERFRGPSEQFGDAMASREPYAPASRDDYFARFVDMPMHVHEAVYKEAFEKAMSMAASRKTTWATATAALLVGSAGMAALLWVLRQQRGR